MVPDILIANVAFLSSLPQEEQQIFLEAAEQSTAVQREEWRKAVDQARQQAQSMGRYVYLSAEGAFPAKGIAAA